MEEIEINFSYVILIYDGLGELKIRRSSNGAKLTIVSSAFVMSSSSSDHMSKFILISKTGRSPANGYFYKNKNKNLLSLSIYIYISRLPLTFMDQFGISFLTH